MSPLKVFPRAFSVFLLLFSHTGLHAAPEGVAVDPTRPPSFGAGAADGSVPEPARVVQSVLIAPGRTMAVVNGETVRVGSIQNGARVVRIDEAGVLLSNNGRLEMLRLFPDTEKSGSGRARR